MSSTLYERDCSIQRRHQKLLEESPSPVLADSVTRRQMGEAAVRAAESVDYDSVGTMEFIYDVDTRAILLHRDEYPHPGGASGHRDGHRDRPGKDADHWRPAGINCGLDPGQISYESGHAIECRINAEDPENNFLAQVRDLQPVHRPRGPGVRIDSGVYPGYVIPPYYDSMIAKLIVWGKTRKEAIARMKRALGEFVVEGVKTTIPFHQKSCSMRIFLSGYYTTNFIKKFFE